MYNAIYLSPHLDDVVLSCGGQIYQQTQAGQKILIATVTAGDPPISAISEYAQSLHDRWELIADAVQARRDEDERAAALIGADVLHWDIPDCIYRFHAESGESFYTSDDEIFGDIHPEEGVLLEKIERLIDALPAHDALYLPLGVGNHVDHRLTRTAAEQWLAKNKDAGMGTPNWVWYYEEYPYAAEEGATETILAETDAAWTLRRISLTANALSARIRAIAQFQSQLSTFFEDGDDLSAQVRRFVTNVGGERLWQRNTA